LKNYFYFSFLTELLSLFIEDDVKLAELSNNSFERKNDIFWWGAGEGVKTYSDPSCVFQGVKTPLIEMPHGFPMGNPWISIHENI